MAPPTLQMGKGVVEPEKAALVLPWEYAVLKEFMELSQAARRLTNAASASRWSMQPGGFRNQEGPAGPCDLLDVRPETLGPEPVWLAVRK